jgi:hypothetical protein
MRSNDNIPEELKILAINSLKTTKGV